MNKPLLLTALALGLGLSGVAHSADKLFSDIPTDAVFAPPGSATAAPRAPARSEPSPLEVAANSLSGTLLAAGYEPKTGEDGSVTVTIKKDDMSLPLRVALSDDDAQLQFGMQLIQVPAGQTLAADKLLSLMQANLEHRPAAFVFDKESRRIELHQAVSNRGLTSGKLREQIDRLADIAVKTRTLWAIDGVSIGVTSTPGATASSGATATSSDGLVGKWVASSTANSAVALQINADGTFRLAVVNGTQQTQSKGKFALTGATLTLSGDDGTRLSGTVQTSTDGFQFQPEGSKSSLTFKRAS
jgi:hypothetical protein